MPVEIVHGYLKLTGLYKGTLPDGSKTYEAPATIFVKGSAIQAVQPCEGGCFIVGTTDTLRVNESAQEVLAGVTDSYKQVLRK